MSGLTLGASMIPGAEGSSSPSAPFGDPAGNITFEINLPEDTGGTPSVPEGTYQARVATIVGQRAKSSGNPMIVVEYAIVGGDYDGKIPGKSYMSQTAAAMFKTVEFCEATGLGEAGQAVSFTPEDAINRLVTLEVVHQTVERDGKERTYANPGSVSPPTAGAGAVWESGTEGIPS